MKKIIQILILLLTIFFSMNSWGQKIVYPWRSTTAIVKAGETFEVWFNADAGQTLNEVALRGPYNNAIVTVTDTKRILGCTTNGQAILVIANIQLVYPLELPRIVMI